MNVRFRLLGPLEVWRDGQVIAMPAGQAPQLLGLLLLHAGQVVGVGTVHEVLWDGDGPSSFRKVVQVRMSQLRRLFEDTPVGIVGSRQGYRIEIPPGSLDLHEFREFVAQGSASALRQAVSLWRGPALTELAGTTRGAQIVAALEEERLAAVEAYAQAAIAEGEHADLPGVLAPVLADHPLRERVRAQLMIALSRAGRQSDALSVFDEGRRILAEELGLDPGAELRAAHTAVLQGDQGQPVPAQLPADLRGFAGRDDELGRLDAVLDTGTTVLITALSGTAGVGKTALAVHWAHRIADRYPDGQLYVNLRGFDPSGTTVAPGEALRAFLDALGVAPQRVPADVDAQAALYRSRLAGKRMLVVLDNARDAEQVRPLLPGAPGCLVIVTSRSQLSSLVATDGAVPVAIDLLTIAEAEELLSRRLGRNRTAAEQNAVREIVDHCARLPLALAIAAARAAARPTFSLSVLAEELRTAQSSLDPLDGGDAMADVRVVFSWSYHALSTEAAHLFRLLGSGPGPDIAAPAAASLACMSAKDVRPLLAELTGVNLITEHVPGRYTSHDLLRGYAAELAHAHDPAAERRAATHRLLDHYLHSARAADRLLRPHSPPPSAPGVVAGVAPETFTSVEVALAWFAAESDVLLACIMHAPAAGFDAHTWQLALHLFDYLERSGRWHDHLTVQTAALAAAERLSDPLGQAHARRLLGRACVPLGRYADAITHLRHAWHLYGELGDRFGQANTDLAIGHVFERQERHADALGHTRQALELFRAIDHQAGTARALGSVGWVLAQLGEYEEALRHCQDASALLDQTGDPLGLANAIHSVAYIHQQLGNHADALARYRQALVLFRETGERYNTADTLTRLGELHHVAGDPGAARDAWHEALVILTELGHPDAEQVRTHLLDLDQTGAHPL